MLNDYRVEASRSFGLAKWMIPVGACLLAVFLVVVRLAGDEPEEESEEVEDSLAVEALHVVPSSTDPDGKD